MPDSDPATPQTYGLPEEWILDAVDAWHQVPRNELGLALLDDELAFVLSKVAPSIADQARAEGQAEERALIVAWLRSNAADIDALRAEQTTVGARFDGWQKSARLEAIADAIEEGKHA